MKSIRYGLAVVLALHLAMLSACGGGSSAAPVEPTPTIVAPSIATQPVSQTVTEGQTVTFSVSATGDAPLSYQWQRDGADVAGAKAAQFSYVAQSTDKAVVFNVKVSNASPSIALSDSATLTVRPPSVSIFAGKSSDTADCKTSDGKGTAATFCSPIAIAVAESGNVYVAENEVIRKITPDGTVTTLAGVAGVKGVIDGASSVARFYQLLGIAIDSKENVYVTESRETNNSGIGRGAIRLIDANGNVRTVAARANGFEDERYRRDAGPVMPVPLLVDTDGNLYVRVSGHGNWSTHWVFILKVSPAKYFTNEGMFRIFSSNGTTWPNPDGELFGVRGSGEGVLLWDAAGSKTAPVIFVSMCTEELYLPPGKTFLKLFDSLERLVYEKPYEQPTFGCFRVITQDALGTYYTVLGSIVGELRVADGSFTAVAGPDGTLDLSKARPVIGPWGVQALASSPDRSLYAIVGQGIVRVRLP